MVVCWVCFSSYKRYFYCHNVTGATRWDYPEGPEPDDQPQQQRREDEDTIETNAVGSSQVVNPPLPLGGTLSGANILALAGCPPPPPPPPDNTTEDGETCSDMMGDLSPQPDELELVSAVDPVVVEISAPPMLNWPAPAQSELAEGAPPTALHEVEVEVVSSPTPTARESSPTCASTPPPTPTTDDAATHQHRERRRKKDKDKDKVSFT